MEPLNISYEIRFFRVRSEFSIIPAIAEVTLRFANSAAATWRQFDAAIRPRPPNRG
jgi:hypothetical protein